MQYRTSPKNNEKISALGFGAMRLQSNRGKVDEDMLQNNLSMQ